MSEMLNGLVIKTKTQDGDSYVFKDFGVSTDQVFYELTVEDEIVHISLTDILKTYVNFTNQYEMVYTGAKTPTANNVAVWIHPDGQSL